MNIRTTLITSGLIAASLVSGAAQAALIDRSGGLIYDDVLNITWLADANYAKTSGYDADGLMNWNDAMAWAANLSYGGYDDWRLPTALNADGSGPCSGSNCTGSEMGHMFYVNMGATAGSSILSGSNTANLNLFTNLQTSVYWSGTEYAPNPGYAWNFYTDDGYQSAVGKDDFDHYAWAVRPGDVAAANNNTVPEPQTLALLGLGLLGLAAARRRW